VRHVVLVRSARLLSSATSLGAHAGHVLEAGPVYVQVRRRNHVEGVNLGVDLSLRDLRQPFLLMRAVFAGAFVCDAVLFLHMCALDVQLFTLAPRSCRVPGHAGVPLHRHHQHRVPRSVRAVHTPSAFVLRNPACGQACDAHARCRWNDHSKYVGITDTPTINLIDYITNLGAAAQAMIAMTFGCVNCSVSAARTSIHARWQCN
jgi:hypothetical protein